MTAREVVHRDPVWRDRSDVVIATQIDPGTTCIMTEQLWARRIDEKHYELCCIPFFAYDLALGDVVEVDADFMVQRVARPSGRFVFRVHFDGAASSRGQTVAQLSTLGASLEWSSESLLAVDAPDPGTAEAIATYLQQQDDSGTLIYETGRTG